MWATIKYTASPSKSIVVVIKGPDARAGLNPNLSKTSGIMVPKREARITTENKATPTTKASLGLYEKYKKTYTNPASTTLFKTATNMVLINFCQILDSKIVMVARL